MVVKGRNKIWLDLKTEHEAISVARCSKRITNLERVDLKRIMKQYQLLGVVNDEAIVRNGYEKDLKI